MRRKTIHSKNAPEPNGHYSQAQQFDDLIFVSMQLPNDIVANPDEQTTQVLQNIENIILAAGSNRNRILRLTFYVTAMDLWPVVNDACRSFLGDHQPARGIVCVSALHKGFSIAADAIAHA